MSQIRTLYMTKKHQPRNFFWGLVLIIAGILFLLQNAGLLEVHDVLHRYWPVILILLGLKLLIRKRDNPGDKNSTILISQSTGEAKRMIHPFSRPGERATIMYSEMFVLPSKTGNSIAFLLITSLVI